MLIVKVSSVLSPEAVPVLSHLFPESDPHGNRYVRLVPEF